MARKKQQEVVAAGQPQPQIVYVQQEKKGGCFGRFFKAIGVGIVLLIALVAVGSMMGGGDDESSNPPARLADGSVVTQPADKPETGSAENPAPIGTTLTRDGLEITVNSVVESATAGILTSQEAGWSYLTLDVTIKNVSDETKSFNYLYWSAKDIDLGYTYDDDPFAGDGDMSLGSGDLSPNDLVRGEVVIKVQTEGTRIRIKYDTSPIGGENLYWLFER